MIPYVALLHTHTTFVMLFLLQYLIKTILLLANQQATLAKYSRWTKIPEMVISVIFLLTGLGMVFNLAYYNWAIWVKLLCVFASIPLAVIGFKRGSKILAASSLVLLIGAYGLAEMYKNIGPKTSDLQASEELEQKLAAMDDADYDPIVVGKDIYELRCQVCHGEDGMKGLQGAANLAESKLSDEEIKHIIINGKNSMASYKNLIEGRELDAVVEYIKYLRK